jgi:hypothetical protein
MSCQSVATSASKDKVFALIDECLWYYDVENTTWNPTAVCWKTRPNIIGLEFLAVLQNSYNSTSYLPISLSGQKVVLFNLSTLRATSERILNQGPALQKIFSARSLNKSQLAVYAQETFYSCGSSKWILKRDDVSAVWVWSKYPKTSRVANSIVFTTRSVRSHNVYQLVKTGSSSLFWYHLWILDLSVMRWQLMQRFNQSEVVADSLSLSTWLENDIWIIVSRSHTTLLKSMVPMKIIANPMSRRKSFTLAALNRTSALLFGGLTMPEDSLLGRALNDVWHFSLMTSNWKEVRVELSKFATPAQRFDHAAAVVDSEMFIFGGHNGSGECLKGIWKFNFDQGQWSVVQTKNSGPVLDSFQFCVVSAAYRAGQLWIVMGCESCRIPKTQTWMFIVHLASWEPLILKNSDAFLRSPFLILRLGFACGYLFSLVSSASSLLYMKVGCPGGLASKSISHFTCKVCGVGYYAVLGSKTCSQCPKGTTTATERSGLLSDCNKCVNNYCQHGRCLVVTANSAQAPYCECHFGFTGSRCQYATYYYISLGVLLLVAAIAVSVTIVWYTRRKKKINERLFLHQIQRLNDVWQIGWDEITVQGEVGGGASGKVLLAKYRDLPVAVKMLRTEDDPQDSLKFAEEIKFMQTMRHPNIVLFIGAGKTTQEQPFLVLEFTSRGSLRRVLDDATIQLTNRTKLDFAIDACKGMAFLHSLDPPRIHRDLKGENLLVSESWVVKVADFGLGRPINRFRPAKRRKHAFFNRRSLNQPLLELRSEMSLDGIGTVRWSAPELLRGDNYDGSVDAYSFGIVLWEIWTRQLPFHQYRFCYVVASAVERGERPPIPDNCPAHYVDIMRACWNHNPFERPPFNEVLYELEKL